MANFKLYHNNNRITTLQEFSEYNRIYFDSKFTLKEFFEKNRNIIFSAMTNDDKYNFIRENKLYSSKTDKKGNKLFIKVADLTSKQLNINMTLPCPCYLYIDKKYVTYNLAAKHTNFQESVADVTSFDNEYIKNIVQDDGLNIYYDTKKIKPGCKVLGFFKSMYFDGKNSNNLNIYDDNNQVIDISDFVLNMNTTVTEDGGRFSLSLPHIPLYTIYDKESEGGLASVNQGIPYSDKNSIVDKSPKDIISSVLDKSQFEKLRLFTRKNSKSTSSSFYSKSELGSKDYFSWLIQNNDILFISFDDQNDMEDYSIADRTFDMIALVDNVAMNKDSAGNYTVNISGRDLMKLITDDSHIFFPQSVASGSTNPFSNTSSSAKGDMGGSQYVNGKLFTNDKRMLTTGTIRLFRKENNGFTIDFIIKSVISQLANLQIAPDELFIQWGDKRTKFSDIAPK